MKRTLLLSFGWLAAGTGLYAASLLLDVYWNLFNWKPRWDWPTYVLIGAALASLIGLGRLARTQRDRPTQAIALTVCLGLVIVACVALAAEPLSEGLLGRESASPWWYRAGRLVIMSLPLALWLRATLSGVERGPSS
jgi:hypothetical protein